MSASITQLAEDRIFKELSDLIKTGSIKSVFAVRGTISVVQLDGNPICESDEVLSALEDNKHDMTAARKANVEVSDVPMVSATHRMRCDPITIRRDSDDQTTVPKVNLPCGEAGRPAFEQLLKDCQPATLGVGGRDVLDETYRKAGKLDETAFGSNFNPYALGIFDTAAEGLVPERMAADEWDARAAR